MNKISLNYFLAACYLYFKNTWLDFSPMESSLNI